MTRLLILLILCLWLIPQGIAPQPHWVPLGPLASTAVFLGGYAALVLGTGLWGRLASRRIGHDDGHWSVHWFNWAMEAARFAVPAWLAAGIFLLGWPELVDRLIRPAWLPAGPRLLLPWLLAGTLPALLAWAGLWWSQYPTDRACREQSMGAMLDEGLPVHSPPDLRSYLAGNLRQQLLFILLPVALVFLIRDGVTGGLWLARRSISDGQDAALTIGIVGLVFLLSPEVLRRVLGARPLPDSALRRRLEAMCRRAGLRYRDILLWPTHHSVSNAAVMGLLPQLRYVMLSDLLLETMTDRQIEAVFAHETGHIVHRHMMWYGVFFVTVILLSVGADKAMLALARRWPGIDVGCSALATGAWLTVFGFLSRRFERQADVYAARTIQATWPEPQPAAAAGSDEDRATNKESQGSSPVAHRSSLGVVGEQGAAVFASALRQVAVVNNIPIRARSWCHGSIASRMRYLHELSAHPHRTGAFDRFMTRLCIAMGAALLACGAWAALAG